ncbi:MAG: hypothetical protein J6B32_04785, partial [Spirochaetaceae bacterium]|nr:hypothetical protein [Spirochaetaceae bacterium]
MKRIIQILLLVLMTFSLFATSKPSLDGRAVVADEGILPRGLFAKTVGYLPGDSVSVTNPATGVTVNVLVLGSLDPSAGIAIMLSPEAADKLFISPNINTQVKITKRMGLLDQASTGSAILSADPDKDTEASIPSDLKEDLDSRLAEYDKNKPLFPEDLEELPLEEEVALIPEELPLEEEVALVPEELPLEDEVALVPEELPLEDEVALVPEELPLEEEVALVPEELPLEDEVVILPEEIITEEIATNELSDKIQDE